MVLRLTVPSGACGCQVILDHQVFNDVDGALLCNWDYDSGRFPEGVVEEMFESYFGLLKQLAASDAVWDNPTRLAPQHHLQEQMEIQAKEEREAQNAFLGNLDRSSFAPAVSFAPEVPEMPDLSRSASSPAGSQAASSNEVKLEPNDGNRDNAAGNADKTVAGKVGAVNRKNPVKVEVLADSDD